MYLTCAATVRFMSESCPLASRTRAVARMVRMELPSSRRNCAAGPSIGASWPRRSWVSGALRRSRSSNWTPSGVNAERRQNRRVGGVGIHLVLGAEHRQAFHQPAAPYQARLARLRVALGGDVSAVKKLGGNASHRK